MNSQIEEFIEENKYKIDPDTSLLSRCIDGRYEKKENLEPLAKPGADIGDLMMLISANEEYAFGLTREQLVDSLVKTIGGWKNFRCHTDTHYKTPANIFFGDGYLKQAFVHPDAFNLTKDDMKYIYDLLLTYEKEFQFTILEGEHAERAVLIIKSEYYSVYSQQDRPFFQAFIYQKTLDNKRRRLLAKNLMDYIKLDDITLTEEYLYEVMSQVADNRFLEIISRLANKLPMFEVKIEEDESVEILDITSDEKIEAEDDEDNNDFKN